MDDRYDFVRLSVRWICVLSVSSALALGGCSSLGKDESKESWTCFKKGDTDEPCQCQTTPVGGKQEIIDHCGPDTVLASTGATDAECCKQWLWLNGKPVSAYYCSCYVTGSQSCNVAIGDEIVDSCP